MQQDRAMQEKLKGMLVGLAVGDALGASVEFMAPGSFEQGMLMAVNLGDDADTVGAIYGQLAGAYYGLEGIPFSWRQELYDYQTLVAVVEQINAITGDTAGLI